MNNKKAGIAIEIGLLVLLILYLYPIMLVVLNSFKPYDEIFNSFVAFPKSFYIENYIRAWKEADMGHIVFNNIAITAITVTGVIIVTSLAGYRLSRDKSKFSNTLYLLFTIPFLIPLFAYMIPLVVMAKNLHLNNSFLGISLIYMSSSSFGIFLFYGYVKSIPVQLDESAMIDGCTQLRMFFSIIFPLMKPAVSTVAVLFSLWTWNDFLLQMLLLTSRSKLTISVNVFSLFGKYSSDWDIITASLVLASLPIIIIYALLQKYIVSGIAAGAVKG